MASKTRKNFWTLFSIAIAVEYVLTLVALGMTLGYYRPESTVGIIFGTAQVAMLFAWWIAGRLVRVRPPDGYGGAPQVMLVVGITGVLTALPWLIFAAFQINALTDHVESARTPFVIVVTVMAVCGLRILRLMITGLARASVWPFVAFICTALVLGAYLSSNVSNLRAGEAAFEKADRTDTQRHAALPYLWIPNLSDAIIGGSMNHFERTGRFLDPRDPKTVRSIKLIQQWKAAPHGTSIHGEYSSRGRKAMIAIAYRNSVFLMDFNVQDGGYPMNRVYCKGPPLCGLVSPQGVRFTAVYQGNRECRGLDRQPRRWCHFVRSAYGDGGAVWDLSREQAARYKRILWR